MELKYKLILFILFTILLVINIKSNQKYLKSIKAEEYSIVKQTQIWQNVFFNATEDTRKRMTTWHYAQGWSYNYMRDDEVESWMTKTFPSLNFTAIREESPNMMYDLFKYAIIYHNGGFFANSDIIKMANFEKAMTQLSGCRVVVGLDTDIRNIRNIKEHLQPPPSSLKIDQRAFYAAKNHPFMRFVTQRVFRQIDFFQVRGLNLTNRDVAEITGQNTWTDSIADYVMIKTGINIKEDLQCGGSYKLDDICILNVKPFLSTRPVRCEGSLNSVKQFEIITSSHSL